MPLRAFYRIVGAQLLTLATREITLPETSIDSVRRVQRSADVPFLAGRGVRASLDAPYAGYIQLLLFKESGVTIAQLVPGPTAYADPATWWWVVGLLVTGPGGDLLLLPVLCVRAPAPLAAAAYLLPRTRSWSREYSRHRAGLDRQQSRQPYRCLLILLAQKRRIRFIIWAPFLGVPLLRWVLRLGRVIPIDGSAGPRAIIHALRQASDALAAGDVVCIFAEGGITRTGFMLPFHRGMEQIVKRTPVPIVPVCLDHVWGSIFSYQGGQVFLEMAAAHPLSRLCQLRPAFARDGHRLRGAPGHPEALGRFGDPPGSLSAGPCIGTFSAWP